MKHNHTNKGKKLKIKIKTDVPEDEAKQYLKKYNLEKFFQNFVNNIMQENPENPIVYMIKYIAGEMSKEEKENFLIKIPEPYPQNMPKIQYPNLLYSSSISRIILTKELFKKYKNKKTKFKGNIIDILQLGINISSDKIGCMLIDGSSIEIFPEFFYPIIEKYHNIKINENNKYFEKKNLNLKDNFFPKIYKLTSKCVIMRFIVSRNLSNFPFLNIANNEQKKEIENILINKINDLILLNILPPLDKYTMKDQDFFSILEYIDYTNLGKCDINIDYNNRVIYSTKDKSLIILINFIEHLQIIETRKKGEINIVNMYHKIFGILKHFEKKINFEYSEKFGYLTSEIQKIGAGFTIYSEIEIYILHQIKMVGGSFKEFLSKSEKDFYIIKEFKDHINFCSYYSRRLSYENDLEFFEIYLNQLCGYIVFDSFSSKLSLLSFKKIGISSLTKDICLKQSYDKYYEDYKYTISPSGTTLNYLMSFYTNDHMNPFGLLIREKEEYYSFVKFFIDYVQNSQNFKIPDDNYFETIYSKEELIEFDFEKIVFDPSDKFKNINISLCLIRNIDGFVFPTHHESQDDKVEDQVLTLLETLTTRTTKYGYYYSLSENNQKEITNKLIEDNHLMIFHKDDMKHFNLDTGYPYHRGVIKFDKEHIFAIVNDLDHLKFFLIDNVNLGEIQKEINDYFEVIETFSKKFPFCKSNRVGYLTSSPRFIGNGLLIRVTFLLDYVQKEDLEVCLDGSEFIYKIIRDSENKENFIVEIVNKITLGISERKLIFKLLVCLKNIFGIGRNRRMSKNVEEIKKKPKLSKKYVSVQMDG